MAENPTSGEQDRSGSQRLTRVGVVAVLAVGVVGAIVLMRAGGVIDGASRSVDGEPMLEVTLEPGAEQAPSSPQLTVQGSIEGVLPVRHGDVLHLELAQIDAAGPLRFEFELPAEQAPDAKTPPRIYAAHLPPVTLAVVGFEHDRSRLRLDVPAGTITAPGHYVVEIRTDEQSPFPLRRFSVEVR